jgi:phenylpropionate dioxygenase-like ring-hydroxylating dioxygenase large terminal subunit
MVRTRGARAPVSVMDRPLFLQRDFDGGLHLFPNVCTHAWHTLVPGPGRERTIRCPQHGREFDCLGKFVHQPGFEKLEGFSTKDDDLRGPHRPTARSPIRVPASTAPRSVSW